jgi:hypothetical protein
VTEYNFDDADDYGNDSDLVKRLRAEIAKRDKVLATKDAEFETLRGEVRRQSVANVLRDMGVKAKVANLIPKDVDPTAEAVTAWVKEYEDVFGSAREATPQESAPKTEQADSTPGPQGQANVAPETIQAWQRMQTAEAAPGSTTPTGDDAQHAFLARAAEAAGGSVDKYIAILRGEINP